jgi:hypothetical protein
MSSELSNDSEQNEKLAEWVGGYVNAEGNIQLGATDSDSMNVGYQLSTNFNTTATAPQMAGLFDGEGYIQYNAAEQEESKNGHYFKTGLGVGINTLNDIERFALWLKTLGLEPTIVRSEPKNEKWEDQYSVRVSSIEAMEVALEELMPYLSRNKFIQSYVVLNELIPRMEEGVHLEKRGFIECMSWVEFIKKYKANHVAPSKEEFERQLFGEQERETFEDKTGPGPRSLGGDTDEELF